MTDFDCIVRERKVLARQAKYRKCGSKSKKCTLPSDRLTKKQWKERCGEVLTYNITEPMSWDDFKRVPTDAQETYLNFLKDEYRANATNMAEMFGVKPPAVRKYIKNKNLEIVFSRGDSMTAAQRERWQKFISKDAEEDREPQESLENDGPVEEATKDGRNSPTEEIEYDPSVAATASMDMTEFVVKFSGKLCPDAIANSLRVIMGNDSTGTVEVRYVKA